MSTIERIAAVVQPLRDELARIDEEIVASRAALVELYVSRKMVADILKRADGKPAPAKKSRAQQAVVSERWVNYVNDFIEHAPINRQQIVASPLYRLIKTDAVASGAEYPGADAVRRAVHVLHESGVLRLVARGRGGSNIYAYIGGPNGQT